MDGGVISGATVASVFNASLRISQVVYELKAVGEQTRDLLETTKHIDGSSVAVRRIRRQKSGLLNETEKEWIDGVLKNTELAVNSVAKLIEPARVDMETRSGRTKDIRLWHRTLFVLRDSPKVNVNLMRLSVASQGLYAAMVILCNREGYGDNNLNVPMRGGTIKRRASSPGGPPPPPPYEYKDFLNRRRVSAGDKKKRLLPKASKVSFKTGDDEATLCSSDTEERDEFEAGRWIEPEDIIDPIGRGVKEIHPDSQIKNATVSMVKLVEPQTIDQSPACAPDPPAPAPGEDWADEALRNFHMRQEISNRMLRHEQSIQKLKAELTNTLTPSGLGISATGSSSQNFPDRIVSSGSRPAFHEEFCQPPRPSSSQSMFASPPSRTVQSEMTLAGSSTPPPVPPRPSGWTTSTAQRPDSKLAGGLTLPYPDGAQSTPDYPIRRHVSTEAQYIGALPHPSRLSPVRMPSAPLHQSPPSMPGTFRNSQSLWSDTIPVPPAKYSALTHFRSAPTMPETQRNSATITAPVDFPYAWQQHAQVPLQPLAVQKVTESQPILQPAYSHIRKDYSIFESQPEQIPESRRRHVLFSRSRNDETSSQLPQLSSVSASGLPHAASSGHNRDLSHSSSVHSYEPFDPTTVKRLSSGPLESLGATASRSTLSLSSTAADEPSAFEYAAVIEQKDNTTNDRSGGTSGADSVAEGGVKKSPVSRGRVGLEYRMSMVDEEGPREGRGRQR